MRRFASTVSPPASAQRHCSSVRSGPGSSAETCRSHGRRRRSSTASAGLEPADLVQHDWRGRRHAAPRPRRGSPARPRAARRRGRSAPTRAQRERSSWSPCEARAISVASRQLASACLKIVALAEQRRARQPRHAPREIRLIEPSPSGSVDRLVGMVGGVVELARRQLSPRQIPRKANRVDQRRSEGRCGALARSSVPSPPRSSMRRYD